MTENLKVKEYVHQNASAKYNVKIVWRNVIIMLILHVCAIYGYIYGIVYAKWQTWVFGYFLGIASSIGIQVGAHRLWAHRSFKAKLPLRIVLAFLQTLSLQNDIYEWCRDHRVHHKYSETDADPHNSNRGFFFAHIGWLLCKKHPDVKVKGKCVDLSDLLEDPIIEFQRKYYIPLVLIIWGVIPTYIPYVLWSESKWISFLICVAFRYIYILNVTWLVNSAAHMWGTRPYDVNINPVEVNVRYLLHGEGFHNYHHTFPWDYSASELGSMDIFNPATAFIDFCAIIGLAYDLKTVSPQIIRQRQRRSGHPEHAITYKPNSVWEWAYGMTITLWPIWSVYVIRKAFYWYFTIFKNPKSILFL